MNIFSLGLSPNEFMALCYLVHRGGRVTGSEVAEVTGSSSATGRRTLSQLESRGLISRVSRGHFKVDERSLVSAERSLVSETFSVLLTTSSSNYMPLSVPNGTDKGGACGAPEQQMIKREVLMVAPGRLSDDDPRSFADDLSEDIPRPKKVQRGPTKWHRDNDPIETWTVSHVVKEFQIRIYQALPDYLYPVDGRDLTQTLGRLHRQDGVTVQQMISAMDAYFTDEVQRVPRDRSPMGHFLLFLDKHRRLELASQPETIDADYIARFNKGW